MLLLTYSSRRNWSSRCFKSPSVVARLFGGSDSAMVMMRITLPCERLNSPPGVGLAAPGGRMSGALINLHSRPLPFAYCHQVG
jgi:hypothetical protein